MDRTNIEINYKKNMFFYTILFLYFTLYKISEIAGPNKSHFSENLRKNGQIQQNRRFGLGGCGGPRPRHGQELPKAAYSDMLRKNEDETKKKRI